MKNKSCIKIKSMDITLLIFSPSDLIRENHYDQDCGKHCCKSID